MPISPTPGLRSDGTQRSEHPVPDGEEQPEIHIAFARPIHVMQCMHRADGEKLLQGSEGVVHIRVLHDELQCDGEANHYGNRDWHADQHQRNCAGHDVERLVQRVAHEAIEAVEAMYPMMYGMQPPQEADAMATLVDHCHRAIDDKDRHQELQGDRQ